MNRKSSLRLIRRLGLALAVAAFAAPGAGAAPQVLYPDDLHASVPHVPALNLTYADDLIRPTSSEPSTQVTDSLGRPLPPEVIPPTSDDASSASDSSGFEWNTPASERQSVFALMLLSVGVLLVGRHNRRSRLAAA